MRVRSQPPLVKDGVVEKRGPLGSFVIRQDDGTTFRAFPKDLKILA